MVIGFCCGLERRLVGRVTAESVGRIRGPRVLGRPGAAAAVPAATATATPATAGPPWPAKLPPDRLDLTTLAEALRSDGPTSSTSIS